MLRIEVQTRSRTQLVEITEQIRGAVGGTGLRRGAVLVYSPHTTAGVTIQETADPDVQRDLLLALENAVPERAARGEYRHAEGNSDAHVKTSLVGASQLVPVEDGELVLGTWQGIYLYEHRTRPHRRELVLHLIGDPG